MGSERPGASVHERDGCSLRLRRHMHDGDDDEEEIASKHCNAYLQCSLVIEGSCIVPDPNYLRRRAHSLADAFMPFTRTALSCGIRWLVQCGMEQCGASAAGHQGALYMFGRHLVS
jgi:hypothetical protein